ncbi:MAG: ATP-binding cassette domain-containing protein [Actinomycetota bacterium]
MRADARERGVRAALSSLPVAVLVGFLLWFGLALSHDRYWMQLGVEAMWVAASVIGLNVLLGYTGLLSLGHGVFFILGGFVGAVWAVEGWGLDPWLGFPVAFALGMLLGAVLALTCCHLRGFYLTAVTIAFGLLLSSTALIFDRQFNGLSGRAVTKPLDTEFSFLDSTNPNRYLAGLYWLGVAMVLLFLYVVWNLVHSRWGRAYKAIREAEVAAEASGIPTYLYKVSSFSLSAGMVSMAGVLAAQTTLQVRMVDGTAAVGQSFQLVIDAVVGGLGTLAGPVVGAFALTLGLGVDIGGKSIGNRIGEWETALLAGVVIAMVIAAPDGFAGVLRRAASPVLRRVRVPASVVPPAADIITGDRPGAPAPSATRGEPEGPLLEVNDLTLTFGGLAALSNVDLAFERGTVHALIGPNGSGKSTLVNVVSGIYRADSGRVRLGGEDLASASPHRRARMGVARTFQSCQIWRRMTVLDNVLVGAHTRTPGGLARSLLLPLWLRPWERSAQQRALDLLRFVGLAGRATALAGVLPFADQRRLEIARALASEPRLLILDEPAAGMHPTEVRGLIELVRSVKSLGITVLLIEHHMEVVSELADRVTVLSFGQVIAQGPPAEMANDQRVIEAYLGEERRQRPSPVVAATGATGPRRPSPAAAALAVRSLRVRYGGAPALERVDLDVFPGEVVALIGANGAGKSTTLKTISGMSELLKSVEGEITLFGQRIDHLAASEIAKLGMVHVPEGRRVFPESTVEENLLLGAHLRRDRGISADVEAVYERFPVLGRRRRQPAGLLSGGEQQMLAFGRALTARPRLMLLDEPSLGLAPIIVDEVFEVIRALSGDGVTILLVEQLAKRALELADRAYVLDAGRISKSGDASLLALDPEVAAAYLGGVATMTAPRP